MKNLLLYLFLIITNYSMDLTTSFDINKKFDFDSYERTFKHELKINDSFDTEFILISKTSNHHIPENVITESGSYYKENTFLQLNEEDHTKSVAEIFNIKYGIPFPFVLRIKNINKKLKDFVHRCPSLKNSYPMLSLLNNEYTVITSFLTKSENNLLLLAQSTEEYIENFIIKNQKERLFFNIISINKNFNKNSCNLLTITEYKVPRKKLQEQYTKDRNFSINKIDIFNKILNNPEYICSYSITDKTKSFFIWSIRNILISLKIPDILSSIILSFAFQSTPQEEVEEKIQLLIPEIKWIQLEIKHLNNEIKNFNKTEIDIPKLKRIEYLRSIVNKANDILNTLLTEKDLQAYYKVLTEDKSILINSYYKYANKKAKQSSYIAFTDKTKISNLLQEIKNINEE